MMELDQHCAQDLCGMRAVKQQVRCSVAPPQAGLYPKAHQRTALAHYGCLLSSPAAPTHAGTTGAAKPAHPLRRGLGGCVCLQH